MKSNKKILKRKKKGFTLIELLATIVILAIVLSIAIVSVSGLIANARAEANKASIKIALKFAGTEIASGKTSGRLEDLKITNNTLVGNWHTDDGKTAIIDANSMVNGALIKSDTTLNNYLQTEVGNSVPVTNLLRTKILGTNNSNVITTGFDYGALSSNLGLYVQKDNPDKTINGAPVYFYKGVVTNNYVRFGTYKNNFSYATLDINYTNQPGSWSTGNSIDWRIIRINEDNTIRLMSTKPATTTMHYDTTAPYTVNYNESLVKPLVDSWYTTHITGADNDKVANSVFCNDLSNAYSARLQYSNMQPTFTCTPTEAVKINSKVGLITADELAFSGMTFSGVISAKSYLKFNTNFGTLTEANTDNVEITWLPYNQGLFTVPVEVYNGSFGAVYNGINYFPVINLNPDVIVTSGDGTSANPYVIG